MMIKVIFLVPHPHCFLQVGGPQFLISQLKEVGPRKSIYVGGCGIGALHGQEQSGVILVYMFFRDLRPFITMLPLAPLLSFPEAEDPLVLASVSPFQGPALTSPCGCVQHLTGRW